MVLEDAVVGLALVVVVLAIRAVGVIVTEKCAGLRHEGILAFWQQQAARNDFVQSSNGMNYIYVSLYL